MTLTRRLLLSSAAGLAAASILPRGPLAAPAIAAAAPATQVIGGAAFGSVWRLTLPADADTGALTRLVTEQLAAIDAQMSPWRTDSAISRINRAGPGQHQVPAQAAAVAQTALALARDSGGAFDPTVGPLVARWGFGPIHQGEAGRDGLAAGPDHIAKASAAQTLDLCGIAKGYALDRIAERLSDHGQGDFLLDLGGELTARGRHPSGRHWQIAVEDPRGGHDGAAEILALDGLAVATSGDRINGYDLGGRRVGHIIDPGTGAPAAGGLASVSVIAADGVTADGWATALFAAGAEAGPRMATASGLAALFLIRDAGGLRRIDTPGLARHLA